MNFSPSTVLEKVSKNKDVSIEKCRQMAIIAGAEPQSFFDIRKHEKTALAIENKKELLSKLNKQAVISSSILSYVPATFKNIFTRKNVGGKSNQKLGNLNSNHSLPPGTGGLAIPSINLNVTSSPKGKGQTLSNNGKRTTCLETFG